MQLIADTLEVRVENDALHIGPVVITFQRTLRIPDDGNDYPLPPGLGRFPIRRVADYAANVPDSWREHGGVFIPLWQREALWLRFTGIWWRPNALKVGVGKVNAVSGRPWSERLEAEDRDGNQDYLVVPEQPWLDGINAGDGTIRQFVAMPLGMGYTVEGQITGEERHGGVQLCVFEPKPGKFTEPETPRVGVRYRAFDGEAMHTVDALVMAAAAPAAASPGGLEMGLGAGGSMKQRIYPDRHGIDTWDQGNHARVFVHLCNSQLWREITGEAPPETPVSARTYTQHGYPWFDIYDEDKGDVKPSDTLKGVKSVKGMDEQKGFGPQQDDSTVDVSPGQVKHLPSVPTAS
jgi:hypothetical protein